MTEIAQKLQARLEELLAEGAQRIILSKPAAKQQTYRKAVLERKTGARGLRGIMEEVLKDLMFRIPSDKEIVGVLIDADCVNKKGEPKFTYKEGADQLRFYNQNKKGKQ